MSLTGGPGRSPVDRHLERLAEGGQLVGGGGPVRVGRHEERSPAELDGVPGELGGRGRLARALEADEHDHGRIALEVEGPVAGRQEGRELLVDDGHDLLAGRQALEDVRPDRPLTDPGDEIPDDLEVDVRLEQGEADLAHRGVDVGLAYPAPAGQRTEGLAEPLAQRVKHGRGVSRDRSEAGPAVTRPAGLVREFWRTEAPGL